MKAAKIGSAIMSRKYTVILKMTDDLLDKVYYTDSLILALIKAFKFKKEYQRNTHYRFVYIQFN